MTRPAVVYPAADRRGGVERVVHDFTAHLGRRADVSFVGSVWDAPPAQGVHHQAVRPRFGGSALAPPAFRRGARAVLAALSPSCTVTFGAECPPGDVYWVGSVHRAWLEQPSTVRVRGIAVPRAARYALARHQVLLQMERQYFTRGRPRAILCTSQREVDDLARLYAVPRDVMTVMPNGYDPAQFSVPARQAGRAAMRSEIGAAPDDVVLLFVANELHRKGFAQVLEAMDRVGDPRLRLDLVGRKPLDDYAGDIARRGLTDRVRWHGSTDDVGRYHAAADLLVLPTQYEPFGLVIVEALASGLPVITTRLAGAAEAIVTGGGGLLQQDPFDVEELTELLRVALDPAARARWETEAPGAALPYRWSEIFARVEQYLLP